MLSSYIFYTTTFNWHWIVGKPYRKQPDISNYGSCLSTDPHSIKQSSYHGNLLVLLICVFLYTVVISLTARDCDTTRYLYTPLILDNFNIKLLSIQQNFIK